MNSVFLKPRISEKTYELSNKSVYVFEVPKMLSKQLIADSVESQFKVSVENVRVMNIPQKSKRLIRNQGKKVSYGIKSGFKKAYVTLKKGDTIAVFASDEEKKSTPEAKVKRGKK